MYEQTNSDYFILSLMNNNMIKLSYFKRTRNPQLNYKTQVDFLGWDSQQISYLLYFYFLICNRTTTSHALYLGRELYKAEICMIMQQHYIQD